MTNWDSLTSEEKRERNDATRADGYARTRITFANTKNADIWTGIVAEGLYEVYVATTKRWSYENQKGVKQGPAFHEKLKIENALCLILQPHADPDFSGSDLFMTALRDVYATEKS